MADENEIEWFMRATEEGLGKYWPGDRPGTFPLLWFVQAVRRGSAPDEEVMRWVAAAFEKILAGEKPDKALELKRDRRGTPKLTALWARDLAVMLDLVRCLNVDSYVDGAIEAVSLKHDVDEETVRKIYKEHVLPARSSRGKGSK